jgi:hypothetical protein
MKIKEKISLESINDKMFKIKIVDDEFIYDDKKIGLELSVVINQKKNCYQK